MKVYVEGDETFQYLFQNMDLNGHKLGLYRGSNNVLTIDFNGTSRSTGKILNNKDWKTISFSWEKVISSSSVATAAYNIRVMVDSVIYEK